MSDRVEQLGGSVIQYGPNSRRVYLMKLDPADLPGLHGELEQRAQAHGYGKIFAKVPADALASFRARGYREEARIPRYYRGRTDAVLLGRYFKPERQQPRHPKDLAAVLRKALAVKPGAPVCPATCRLRVLTPDDVASLAQLYARIFPTYPFPITDPAYLLRTMASQVAYYGVFEETTLVAAASAECDPDARAVEMTDFATLPDHRGQGLARLLLAHMDREMGRAEYLTACTIARAVSFGMNITFARAGYRFGGALINNTGISGAIETMNVWYKSLA